MAYSRKILLLGSNDRAGLATCRALGRAGHQVSILRLTTQSTPADHSRFCAESLYIAAPDSSVSNYVAKLEDLLRRQRYDYLMPIDDLACELVYSDYYAISSLTRVIGPNPASYAVARNSFEALAIAESLGLARPVTHLIKRGGVPSSLLFLPCFVRPVVSCAIVDDEWQRFTTRKVTTIDELDAKLRDDLPRVDVLLQAPVPGASLSLNCCSIDGDVLGASATVCLHETPRYGRTYQRIEHMTCRLVSIVQSMASQLSWTGFLTIDCEEAQELLYFMTLTGRPCDAIELSIFSGVDFPNLILNGLEGKRGRRISLPLKTVYMRDLRRDLGWVASEMRRGGGASVIASWTKSFARVLVGRECFSLEQVGDPMPAVCQFDCSVEAFRRNVKRHISSALRLTKPAMVAKPTLTRSDSLLIVCLGNINRSVVAEHLFRARGFSRVRSAGLLPMAGRRPSIHAERFLSERFQMDASAFRSKSVKRALEEIGDVDIVLCFERAHVVELVRRFQELSGKIFLLSELADDNERQPDIADPHGAEPEAYLACFQRIQTLVEKVVLTSNFTGIRMTKSDPVTTK